MDADSKSVLLSKTCIANIALASVLELHPGWALWAQGHPQSIILGYTLMNIVLRQMTTTAVHWMPKKDNPLC
jgi:hypothetical protein